MIYDDIDLYVYRFLHTGQRRNPKGSDDNLNRSSCARTMQEAGSKFPAAFLIIYMYIPVQLKWFYK